MKLYLAHWEFAETGSDIRGWFTPLPDSAATWAQRDVAMRHCRDFNRHGVTLPCHGGDTDTLRNFSIESRPDRKLVLACEAPILTDTNIPVRLVATKPWIH
jgi:hypothetical protein